MAGPDDATDGTPKYLSDADVGLGAPAPSNDGPKYLSDADAGLAPAPDKSAPPPNTAGPKYLSDDDVGVSQMDTQPSFYSTALQVPTGFNETLANLAGMPVDAATWLLNRVLAVPSHGQFKSVNIQNPFGGSESIKRGMGYFGINPDLVPARNSAERIARGVGAGVAGVMAPEAVVATLGRTGAVAPKVLDTFQKTFGSAENVPTVLSTATAGGVGGGTGKALEEVAPKPLKPLADIVGNVVGGGATALGTGLVREGFNWAKSGMAPFTTEGKKDLAAEKMRGAASHPDDTAQTIEEGGGLEIVPGSKPTTFQATGDMGLGELERGMASQNPAAFSQRRAEQNSARVGQLSGVQQTGSPADVTEFLRNQYRSIDDASQAEIDRLTAAARGQTEALGPGASSSMHGENMRSVIMPKVDAAKNEAAATAEALGGQETAEIYGHGLRNPLEAAHQQARAQERLLWKAVDPDGKLVTEKGPVIDAAKSIYEPLSAAAVQGMSPAEHEALAVINQYEMQKGSGIHLKEMTDFRSNVSADMREELEKRGNTATYARLRKLRTAIEEAINTTVGERAAQEQQAVASGAMKPEDTMFAKMQEQANAFTAAKRQREAGETLRTGTLDDSRTSTSSVHPGEASGVEEGGGPGIVAGSKRLGADEELTPNLDQTARQRLNAATDATRGRAETYGRGDIKQILGKETGAPDYKMIASAVPEKIFHPGNTGGQDIEAYLYATHGDPQAIAALHNYAAYSLRRSAMRQDGTIDPRKFATWQRNHQEALNALPPEISERFADAARASEALKRFEPFRPDTAPSAVPELFFHPGKGGGEGVNQFRSIVGDADTADKMLSDYAADTLVSKVAGPDGTLDPKKFETWRNQHAEALAALPPELSDRFSSAAKASEAIAEAAAQRKKVLDTYQKSSLGKLMNIEEPDDIVRSVGAIFSKRDRVAQMKQLAAAANKDPAAKEGLRKSIVDYMMGKFLGNTEAATSGTALIKGDPFQTFMRENEAVLAQVFTPEEISSMKAVAADLQRANRSVTAVKLPGGSNTTQDTIASRKVNQESSVLRRVVSVLGGGLAARAIAPAGKIVTPIAQAIGSIAGHAANALRDAGMREVDDIVREALLNPDLAATLLKRTPVAANRGSYITLGQKLKRLSMFGAAQGGSTALQSTPDGYQYYQAK